jgi:hypothetical protein
MLLCNIWITFYFGNLKRAFLRGEPVYFPFKYFCHSMSSPHTFSFTLKMQNIISLICISLIKFRVISHIREHFLAYDLVLWDTWLWQCIKLLSILIIPSSSLYNCNSRLMYLCIYKFIPLAPVLFFMCALAFGRWSQVLGFHML